jgi:hypothetical protein
MNYLPNVRFASNPTFLKVALTQRRGFDLTGNVQL